MNLTRILLKTSVLLAALSLAHPLQAGPAVPQIAKGTLLAAVERYAPILVLHQYEKYLPTCVESYLKVTEPFTYKDRDDKKQYKGLRLKTTGSDSERDQRRAGDPANAKVYVNVRVGAQTTDIQYWFLYAYNGPGTVYLKQLKWGRFGPMGDGQPEKHLDKGDYELTGMGIHEGDWEHIMVTIDNRTGLASKGIYMASHDSGQYFALPAEKEARVQVYASRNGHATSMIKDRDYNKTVKAGPIELRLLNDTTLPGMAIDYRKRCELIGIHGDQALTTEMNFKEPRYVAEYPGRWGRVQEKAGPCADVPGLGKGLQALLEKIGVWDELTFEAGPQPPWSKGSWTGGE